jgi:cytochrome o ubiquinol oxidase operon protein cyoD
MEQVKLSAYINGFIGSLVLTIVSYLSVANHILSRNALIATIITLALVQFIIQLIFFLHVGVEKRPRWKFLVFSFMVLVVSMLVLGSLWIMNNLDYHTMTDNQYRHYFKVEEGL